jgi:polyhydroxyalkanoate synthesis repressor PhaR
MAQAKAKAKNDNVTVIKKYANRRLYDTGRSSYVTLDDLCIMVKEGHDFAVYDAKSGDDITRQVLTQIIVDQESKGENMLPVSFLRQVIGFYGDSLQSLLPDYLDQTINSFTKNQEEFRKHVNKSLETMSVDNMGSMGMMNNMGNPVTMMEEMSRKNMEMFQKAMEKFQPFVAMGGLNMDDTSKNTASSDDEIDALKRNIAEMEKEISRLSK